MGTVTINSVTINSTSGISIYGPFYHNTMITSVDLSNSAWTNNSMKFAFNGCTKLTTVTNIHQNVTDMRGTFYGCYNLVNVPAIPNSVTDMGYTFAQCYKLTNIPVIPNSVTNLAETFQNCRSLINAPIIPNSVTIMYRTFGTCNSLTTAPVIPDSVTTIAALFDQCSNLQSFPSPIPYSITNMYATFYGCKNLQSDIYVDSTQIITAMNCFGNITNTRNVYIPFNTSLGIYSNTYNSFRNAGYTTSGSPDGVYLKENPAFEAAGDWWWNKDDGIIHKYLGSSTTITIPNSINGKATQIYGRAAFNGMVTTNTLTSIDLNNVNIIGDWNDTFGSCRKLVSITNLTGNPKILSNTFHSCELLTTTPIIPDGVTNIHGIFYYGGNCLTSLPAIPESVINMRGAFASMTMYNISVFNITIPDNVIDASGSYDAWQVNFQKSWEVNIGRNVTNLYTAFQKSHGNFYIRSNKVTNAEGFTRGYLNGISNVYIPFTNSDGTPSATYQAFITAGYKTDGSYNGVYLKNYTDLYSE